MEDVAGLKGCRLTRPHTCPGGEATAAQLGPSTAHSAERQNADCVPQTFGHLKWPPSWSLQSRGRSQLSQQTPACEDSGDSSPVLPSRRHTVSQRTLQMGGVEEGRGSPGHSERALDLRDPGGSNKRALLGSGVGWSLVSGFCSVTSATSRWDQVRPLSGRGCSGVPGREVEGRGGVQASGFTSSLL